MRNFLTKNGRSNLTKTEQPDSLTAPEEQSDSSLAKTPINRIVRTDAFDQPVILQQTSIWSRGIVWGIVGVVTFAVGWASIAKIEEAVPATGKLEPSDKVQEIQAPVGGVVQEILVEDGQRVQKGDVLLRFDPRAAQAEKESLEEVKTALQLENRFYRSQLLGVDPLEDSEVVGLELRPEILALTRNRASLLEENRLYKAQLGIESTDALTPTQRDRLQVGLAESTSRTSAARYEVAQLQQQLSQTRGQLDSARRSSQIDQGILNDIRPLAEEGGIARLQLRRQEQEVLNSQAEVARLAEEEQRLRYAIAQAQQQMENTIAVTGNDLLNRIAENEKRLAEIDSQLNKSIVENEKRIAEIQSQLRQSELTLQYQEVRAPIDGIVFDLKAKGPGFVANTSEPILKIVPGEGLVAQVYITNQDIGFVREGMPVDVRVDSFPFSEFGDIKGTVVNIGSDALPPDQVQPFYRFPATIELNKQAITARGRDIPLQSGMSVSANIITRDRSVMSIFTEQFTGSVDKLKNVR